MLFCDRPHVKEVDFDAVRLIVSTAMGLNVNGQHLVMGDEVPRGVLSVEALRQIYEPPLRLIETLDYVKKDPSLVEACTRQGTDLDLLCSDQKQDPNNSTDPQALQMCDECGEMFDDLNKHTKKQCKVNQKRNKK